MNANSNRAINYAGNAPGATSRSGADGIRMGRHAQTALRQGGFRTRAVAHRPNTVFARDYGLPVLKLSGAADRLYEGRADWRDRMRQQLDWIRHSSHAGADAGNSAYGRNGQAQFQATVGPIDRRVRCYPQSRQTRPVTRQWQHNFAKRISGRCSSANGRKQCRGFKIHAGSFPFSGRGGRLSR